MNSVTISGIVGQDPRVVYNPNNTVIANASIAVTKSWKGSDNEWKEKTEWISLTGFGELAKRVEVKVKKGYKLLVYGELSNDAWTDKDGKKCSKTYVHIKEFEVIPKTNGPNNSQE